MVLFIKGFFVSKFFIGVLEYLAWDLASSIANCHFKFGLFL